MTQTAPTSQLIRAHDEPTSDAALLAQWHKFSDIQAANDLTIANVRFTYVLRAAKSGIAHKDA